ncbi:MAG: ATP synthase F1 subunit gamma [Elusimicrobia bacterium]|nr:ATP synthase F1 subunit gamma [Elusimicrobiota bacterium]
MPSLREIRKKIKSVKQTQQVTKAIKMIAAARLKKAQGQLIASRPYAHKVSDLVASLTERVKTQKTALPPLIQERPQATTRLLVVITADKGFCGSFNVAILRETLKYWEAAKAKGQEVQFFVVGKKGRDFFSRQNIPMAREFVNFIRRPAFSQAEILGREVVNRYLTDPQIAAVDVLYMDFKSVVRQIPALYKLLPPTIDKKKGMVEPAFDYIYEPAREKILAELLPRYITTELYRLIFEAYTSEQASRMNVMENATKNAGEIIDDLGLLANKVRQASITRELLEVVSGAEALN